MSEGKRSSEVVKLRRAIDVCLGPRGSWPDPPGGWPGEIEAALIDSIFSARATYGGPETGVRAVVGRWRASRGGGVLDDLTRICELTTSQFVEILANRQRVPSGGPDRPTKAMAVQLVARELMDALDVRSARSAVEVERTSEGSLRSAFTSVVGIGDVTFTYFLMLLGIPGVKADTMVRRFVAAALGRGVSTTEAETLVSEVAEALELSPTGLDYAIWSWQRSKAPIGSS